MKRWQLFAAVILGLVLAAPAAWPMHHEGNQGKHKGQDKHEMEAGPADAETLFKGGEGKLKKWLDLSDEQLAKLKEERTKHQDFLKPLREKRRGLGVELLAQVKGEAGDAAIQVTLDSLKAAQKDIDSEKQRHGDALKSILSPTQQAKVVLGVAAAVMKHAKKK